MYWSLTGEISDNEWRAINYADVKIVKGDEFGIEVFNQELKFYHNGVSLGLAFWNKLLEGADAAPFVLVNQKIDKV